MGRPDGASYRRSGTVLWRRAGDVVVLLADGADAPVRLAGTGPALWDLLAEPRTLADLGARLGDVFGAPAGQVAADVEPVLVALVRHGVVEQDGDE